jgi:hypothetical protein
MPELGKKYTCYSCHTKFYDLGKPIPVCPKCGADQRDAEERPATTSHRGRRPVIEEPVEEELPAEEVPVAAESADEEEEVLPEPEREEEAEEEEEEEY